MFVVRLTCWEKGQSASWSSGLYAAACAISLLSRIIVEKRVTVHSSRL